MIGDIGRIVVDNMDEETLVARFGVIYACLAKTKEKQLAET